MLGRASTGPTIASRWRHDPATNAATAREIRELSQKAVDELKKRGII
ncbi:hypothetical protein [Streptomyces sp. NPDC001205]